MSNVSALDPVVNRFRELMNDASNVVFFTGAGISTESGIPDFRSPGGVWSRTTPVEFDDFVNSEDERRRAWQQKFDMHADMSAAEPNSGHLAIARMFADGRASALITQNIDGLHQRSGVPAQSIIELHGNGTYATCLDCSERHELEPILAAFGQDGTLPQCRTCGGLVKTATISFGQAMPVQAMVDAEAAAKQCDLFVAVGSSLRVFPAAGFPLLAKQHGAGLVILNREPTDMDAHADLVVNREIGATLNAVVGSNLPPRES